MKTPEQQAIEKYLSLLPIQYGAGGCACMGPQVIEGFVKTQEPYNIVVEKSEQRTKFIIQVHKYFDITMQEAKQRVDLNKVDFDNPYIAKSFQEQLKSLALDTKMVEYPSGLYPDCSCRMKNVVEVEGHFYRVKEEKSIIGTDYHVCSLGKVGGPYVNV